MKSKKRSLSRRHFLTLAAATAAGCATKTIEEPTTTPKIIHRPAPIRLGVIGCGMRGMQLIDSVRKRIIQNPPAVIAAVCDIYTPRRIRAQEQSEGDACPEWEQLVARHDIDAVIIATPDHWHAPIAIAAIEAGKDVYCERPMALTIEEAKAFRDSALRAKRVVQIGVQEASENRWSTARTLLQNETVGALRWTQADGGIDAQKYLGNHPIEEQATPETLDWQAFLANVPQHPFMPERFFQWRNYWDYSFGIAADFHYPELAALLTAIHADVPERVSAAGGIHQTGSGETPDGLVLNAEYPGGHTVVLTASLLKTQAPFVLIRGHEAALEIRTASVRLLSDEGYGSPQKEVRPTGLHQHLNNWLQCIRSREPCICNEEIGYRAMVAIGMAIEAYRACQSICFDSLKETIFPSPPRVSETIARTKSTGSTKSFLLELS